MKKLSLSKKLLLAGSLIALAIACQSKPVRQPSQPAQPLHTDVEEQGDEEEEESSFWDQAEPFKTEEKQLKAVTAPAPVEPAKIETPKATVAVPVEQSATPVVEASASAAPAASVVETPGILPAAAEAVVEVKAPDAVADPVEKQIAAPSVTPSSATVQAAENGAVSENQTSGNEAP
jgi:hypothetical protein